MRNLYSNYFLTNVTQIINVLLLNFAILEDNVGRLQIRGMAGP